MENAESQEFGEKRLTLAGRPWYSIDMKAVTSMNISDIAKKAGVSTATVSRVLNNSSLVSPKTRDWVLHVIEENEYTPSAIAKNLSARTSDSLGVIFPDIENPFFSSALIGVTEQAEKLGYNVFYFNTDETPEKEHAFLNAVRSRRPAGLIISPADGYDMVTGSTLMEFERHHVPVVLLDRDLQGYDFNLVRAEDKRGAYLAVSALIEAGHRRIAIIVGNPSNRPVFERQAGFREAMQEHGIPIRPDYVVRADQKSEIAYQVTGTLLDLPNPPTAIFTCNNMMTLGCLRCCTERGIAVGKDLSIIGFDEIDILRDVGYCLSVVHRSPREMGSIAMELLQKRLEDPECPAQTRTVETTLILRGSEKLEQS